jgi:hypothetical protein
MYGMSEQIERSQESGKREVTYVIHVNKEYKRILHYLKMVDKRELDLSGLLEAIIMDAYIRHITEELNGIDVLGVLGVGGKTNEI